MHKLTNTDFVNFVKMMTTMQHCHVPTLACPELESALNKYNYISKKISNTIFHNILNYTKIT